MQPGAEDDAFLLHLPDAPVDQALLHLEVGNAVAQQPADAVGLLEHGRRVPGPRQLLRAGEARRARADDGDPLARAALGHLRLDPAFVPAAVDDLALDRFDRDRVVVDVEDAGGLARRRADAPREFGEIVGRVQPLQRRPPLAAIGEVVPVRDQIVDRTAVVTERNPAIHAARRLLGGLGRGGPLHELAIGVRAFRRRLVAALPALDFEKARRLAHGFSSL